MILTFLSKLIALTQITLFYPFILLNYNLGYLYFITVFLFSFFNLIATLLKFIILKTFTKMGFNLISDNYQFNFIFLLY